MKIVFATGNMNKLEELERAMPAGIELIGLNDLGITEDIPEDHETLVENALQKAHYVFEKSGMTCFADDTGLEINALDGAPGVYSARYAGESKSAEANMTKVLSQLEGIINRNARFRTVIAFVGQGEERTFEGVVEGKILEKRQGEKGFGYDPIFQPEGEERSFAQMTLEEKNTMSHRARAFKKLLAFLSS